MIVPDPKSFNKGNIAYDRVKSNYPSFAKYILDNYPEDLKWTEKMYWYFNNINEYQCCPICGKRLKYINFKEGYQEYCSTKCSNSSDIKKQQIAETLLNKYGGSGYKSQEIREKIKRTNIKKYGVEHTAQNNDVKNKMLNTKRKLYGGIGMDSPIIREKVVKTNKERYGGQGNASPIIKEKCNQTNLDKYGFASAAKNESIKNKIRETLRHHTLEKYPDVIGHTGKYWICSCPHPDICDKCEDKCYITKSTIYSSRSKNKAELCTKLYPINNYHGEGSSAEVFVRLIISKFKCQYVSNNFHIIPPKELDVFIPDYNVAIEVNGITWHNINKVEDTYHLNKFNLCNEKNIKLLSIWDNWIMMGSQKVEKIISDIFRSKDSQIDEELHPVQIDKDEFISFINDNYVYNDIFDYQKDIKCIAIKSDDNILCALSYVIMDNSIQINTYCENIFYDGPSLFTTIFKYISSITKYEEISYMTHNDICLLDDELMNIGFIKSDIKLSDIYNVNKYNRVHFEYIKNDTSNIVENVGVRDSGVTNWIYKK